MKVDVNSYGYKIGQNIARIRQQAGLSQEEVSKYGDISRSYYGKIELGLYSPTLKKLQKIAAVLGVKTSDLFKDENNDEI